MTHAFDDRGNVVRDGHIVVLASDVPEVRALLAQPRLVWCWLCQMERPTDTTGGDLYCAVCHRRVSP